MVFSMSIRGVVRSGISTISSGLGFVQSSGIVSSNGISQRGFHASSQTFKKAKITKLRAVEMLKDFAKYEKGDIRVVNSNYARALLVPKGLARTLPYAESLPYKRREMERLSKKGRTNDKIILSKAKMIKALTADIENNPLRFVREKGSEFEIKVKNVVDCFRWRRSLLVQSSSVIMPEEKIDSFGQFIGKLKLTPSADPIEFTIEVRAPEKKIVEDYHARVAREAGVKNVFEELDKKSAEKEDSRENASTSDEHVNTEENRTEVSAKKDEDGNDGGKNKDK